MEPLVTIFETDSAVRMVTHSETACNARAPRMVTMDGPTMDRRWHAMCWDVLGWAVRRRCGRERRWKFNKLVLSFAQLSAIQYRSFSRVERMKRG